MEELKPQFMSDEEVMRYMIQEREPSFFPRSTIQGTSAKNEWRKWERALYNYRKNLESKQMDEKRFTEKDLVSFGNYVLSEERNANIASEENRNVVGDWDVANWEESNGEEKEK